MPIFTTKTVNTNNVWKAVPNAFVTINSGWRKINSGFVVVSGKWKQFYSAVGGTPSIQNSSGTVISTAHVGDRLYGYPGDGTTGTWSYAFEYSSDGGTTWNTLSGGTGTGSGTNTYYHTTVLSDDGTLIRFSVTENSIKRSSASVSMTKYTPVLNTTSYPSDPVLTGSTNVGATLSISSHWKATTNITNDTLPDYYVATWTGASGTTTYSSRSTDNNYSSTWYQYTIASGDAGSSVSVYIDAYNTGGDTTTVTRTSGTVTTATSPAISGSSITPSSGTAGVTTFTAVPGTITGTPNPTTTYQWQYFSNSSYNYVNVSGATSSTYKPPSNFNTAYPNYGFFCLITVTNSAGSATDRPSATLNNFVAAGVPTSPVNSYTGYTYPNYSYTASWTAPSSGTTPIDYFIQVWGSSSSKSGTGSGGTYVNTFGPFTDTSASYSSSYAYNYFQVFARNYDGTSYSVSANSSSSVWA